MDSYSPIRSRTGFMGMTYGVMRFLDFLRKFIMTEGLKLTILTYKWGKCVKPVGK